ncbi:MAG: ATP-binding protein [Acidimicrobiia bacterium]
MKVDELIEIALANADDSRVELVTLEPAEIATEAVSGLAQLVAELVDNALSFSGPGDKVRVSGLFERDDYLISVSDEGVGISEHLMSALNRALEDSKVHIGGPEPRLGIQLVARLAARHGIQVRLVPGMPGTTARASLPARLVNRLTAQRTPPEPRVFAESTPPAQDMAVASARPTQPRQRSTTIDLSRYEGDAPLEVGEPAPEEPAPMGVEEFLERVFAPLVGSSVVADRPAGHPEDVKPSPRPGGSRSGQYRYGTTLSVRVPGENFSLPDDEPSTTAGEGAVDIRKALSSFDGGRRTAADEI